MQRRLIVFIAAAGIGTIIYLYARSDASNRVKQTMLKGVEELKLSEADAAYVRGMIAAGHQRAFDKALNSTRGIGAKFNAQVYYAEIRRHVLDQARAAGRMELADRLEDEFAHTTFDAGER